MLLIRQERISNGWTQEYVAEQIGIRNTTIQAIETGQRLPSFYVLVKLEDFFGVDYRKLFNLPPLQLREQQITANGNQL